MPQTVEHLAILDLLRVKRGIVVVTKRDLVDDELVELVKAEVEDTLEGTTFEGSPIVVVSAYTGQGLEELQGAAGLHAGLHRRPAGPGPAAASGGPQLHRRRVRHRGDRDPHRRLPEGGPGGAARPVRRAGRVRGLQSHRKKVDEAEPGVRLAVNLSGITREDFERGEVITNTGWLRPTTRMDARLKMVRNTRPLKHNETVTCHLFTGETPGRVRLLGHDELGPGEEGWAQIHLKEPLPAVKGDLFVVRSADATLGGGKVVDPHPARRHRRFLSPIIQRLTAMDEGSEEESLLSAVDHWGPCDLRTLSQKANISLEEAASGVRELSEDQGMVVVLGDGAGQMESVAYSVAAWESLKRAGVAAGTTTTSTPSGGACPGRR